ncbi:MAG: ABC transporter permease, partial [Bdellovibrionaceae bacterium]|nr:ABC transporter permease [Bdellovibrio sp.]
MNSNIKNRIISLEPHLVTTNKAKDDKTILDLMPNQTVLAYQSFDLILRTIDGQFRGSQAIGYTTHGLDQWSDRLTRLKNKEGRANSYNAEINSLNLGENEVALGVDLARSLGLLEGDEVTLIPPETLLLSSLETPLFQKVVVKRILITDLYDLDSKLILFNSDNTLAVFAKTLSRKRGFHIWLDDVGSADGLKNNLLQKEIAAETWQEKNSDLFFALLMEKTMIGTFLGLAGLIASSSILTVLALLMSQKKQDIAIIKTLGLSQKKTQWLFTKMGLWISGSAIALGAFLGLAISFYLQYFPVHILPNIYYDSSIPALVDFKFVFVVLGIASILA